jgi:hypothetical protein
LSTTEISVRFLSDHPQAAMHDWLRLLNLLEPEMWNNLGVMPETIKLEVTSRWDDGLVERLAEAMFNKTMVERLRGTAGVGCAAGRSVATRRSCSGRCAR